MALERKVQIKSSDGEEFIVAEAVAAKSATIKAMIEKDGGDSCIVPVLNVNGKTLAKVLEYCKKHASAEAWKEELDQFDREFINVDTDVLYDLIMVSDYLGINDLLDFLCQKVASKMRGKTAEQIRETFNIMNDLIPDEEQEFRGDA